MSVDMSAEEQLSALMEKYAKLEAEHERLEGFIKAEIDHAQTFVSLAAEPEKGNLKSFILRAEQALKGK